MEIDHIREKMEQKIKERLDAIKSMQYHSQQSEQLKARANKLNVEIEALNDQIQARRIP